MAIVGNLENTKKHKKDNKRYVPYSRVGILHSWNADVYIILYFLSVLYIIDVLPYHLNGCIE